MRVLYSSFHFSEQSKIALHLQKKHDWQPVYWMADTSIKEEVTRAFPEIVFQDYIKARRAIHTNRLAQLPSPAIDKPLLDALAVDQVTAMKIFYRLDTTGTSFTFNELIEHYHEQIKFWLTVIQELKIELFVCWTNIHSAEYVLYQLCKYLKIPTLYVDSAWCITKDTHLIARSIEDRCELLRSHYQSDVNFEPQTNTLQQLSKLRGDYSSAKPEYMSSPIIYGENNSVLKKTWEWTREFLAIIRHQPLKKTGLHYKFGTGPYQSEETSGNSLQLFLYRQRVKRNGKRYRKIYDRYVEEVNFEKPYLYFAAPYQPEGTTLPDAGVYDRIILILEMLSRHTPENWTIYYKEHPTTFDSIIGGDLYRSEEFYKKVSKIPKVKMIYYKTDSFKLIDSAQAVASATGTVGWEAIVRGKPSLVFGQVWYLPCDGAFLIESTEDLKKALSQIQAGFIPSEEKILKFAGVVDRFCFRNFKFIDFKFRRNEIENLDEELARYGEYFFRAYEEYRKL